MLPLLGTVDVEMRDYGIPGDSTIYVLIKYGLTCSRNFGSSAS